MSCGPRSSFENEDLVQLRRIFVAACEQLRVGWTTDRAAVREHIANLIMLMACGGERDPHVIQRRVMLHLQN